MLLRDEVRSIVIVGKFGNSVSSTSRRISKTFQEIMNWKSHECRYTEIPQTVDENTVIFVYGWFGLWNDDHCALDKVKKACQSLIRVLKETKNVKLILGMRSDLDRKYHQELDAEVDDQNISLVHYEINLDGCTDIRKDCEYDLFLHDQIIKPCEISDCACKCLIYKMLRKGTDGVIGMPLKISMIKKYHELIANYVDNSDMLKVMEDHFTTLEEEKRYVYEWITYICLKGYFCRSDQFDTSLVEEMNFEINQSSFDENDIELSRYVRMRNSYKLRNESFENAQYVFWHPFIYICAFHYLFYKDPEFVMKHCNVDAILQLVRPIGTKTSYFEVAANNKCVTLFNERIRRLDKKEEYANNPLVAKRTGTEEGESLQIQLGMDHGV